MGYKRIVNYKTYINITNNLMKIGYIQGIPVLDHIIISSNNYFSFITIIRIFK